MSKKKLLTLKDFNTQIIFPLELNQMMLTDLCFLI